MNKLLPRFPFIFSLLLSILSPSLVQAYCPPGCRWADLRFVKKFTRPDFRAKNLLLQISILQAGLSKSVTINFDSSFCKCFITLALDSVLSDLDIYFMKKKALEVVPSIMIMIKERHILHMYAFHFDLKCCFNSKKCGLLWSAERLQFQIRCGSSQIEYDSSASQEIVV